MDIVSKSLKSLEFDKVLERLAGFAKIPQSRKLCLELLPHDEYHTILQEIQFTKEAKKILDMPADIPVEFAADVTKIQNSASASYLSEQELVDMQKQCAPQGL